MDFILPTQTELPLKVAGRLDQHLEGVNKRQLGITGCQGLSDPSCRKACSGEEAKSAFLSFRATSSNLGGSLLPVRKGGSSCTRQPPQFYSVLFLVPRKNEQMRKVINLKALHQWVETPHFKMEGLTTL